MQAALRAQTMARATAAAARRGRRWWPSERAAMRASGSPNMMAALLRVLRFSAAPGRGTLARVFKARMRRESRQGKRMQVQSRVGSGSPTSSLQSGRVQSLQRRAAASQARLLPRWARPRAPPARPRPREESESARALLCLLRVPRWQAPHLTLHLRWRALLRRPAQLRWTAACCSPSLRSAVWA